MMIALLLAAAPAGALSSDVAFELLVDGRDAAAISAIESGEDLTRDPARLLNLGIAYARRGEEAKARALFELAYRARDRVELETATGEWIDSRTLARQALAMLDGGGFGAAGRVARN